MSMFYLYPLYFCILKKEKKYKYSRVLGLLKHSNGFTTGCSFFCRIRNHARKAPGDDSDLVQRDKRPHDLYAAEFALSVERPRNATQQLNDPEPGPLGAPQDAGGDQILGDEQVVAGMDLAAPLRVIHDS